MLSQLFVGKLFNSRFIIPLNPWIRLNTKYVNFTAYMIKKNPKCLIELVKPD
jgi:hypothetical protein